MTFKRVLMPILFVGIMLTMGSMAFAQITCGIASTGPAIAAGSTNGVGAANSQPSALPGPSANATSTGHTEPVAAGPQEVPPVPGGGTVRVSCVNGPVAQTPGVGIMTISFGLPITNAQGFPPAATGFPAGAAGIRVINGTGVFITAGPTGTSNAPTNGTTNSTCVATPATAGCANVGISSVNNSGGTVVIGLGTPVATNATPAQNPNLGISWAAGATGTFDLAGVLVSVNGKTGSQSASLTASGGIVVQSVPAQAGLADASSGTTTVITAITPGITDPVLASGTLPTAVTNTAFCGTNCKVGPAAVSPNGIGGQNNFTIKVTENYNEMFKSAAQFNGGAVFPAGQSSSVQLNIVLNNVPTGFSVSNCSAVDTDSSGNLAGGNPAVTANNQVSNTLNVIFQSDVNLTSIDTVWVTCQVGIGTASTSSLVGASGVTAQVELAPVGSALSSTGTALTGLTTGNIPRYNALLQPSSAITIVTFPATTTTLLVPFAVVGPGFNTGIAVANTTTDVFGTTNGGATPSDGTVLFTLFPQAGGSPITFTSPTVKSGSVYANNVSSFLPSGTSGFTGYIFVSANFPQAHGSATIYDTASGHAALSAPVLVVEANGANIGPANSRAIPEFLGQ